MQPRCNTLRMVSQAHPSTQSRLWFSLWPNTPSHNPLHSFVPFLSQCHLINTPDTRINFIFKNPKFGCNKCSSLNTISKMRGEKFVQLSSLLVSRQKSTEPLPADHPPSTRKTIAVLTVQHKPWGRGAQTSPRITEANPLPNAYFFTVWGLDELSQCVLSCTWAPDSSHASHAATALLTPNVHILPFQHPEAANSSLPRAAMQYSFCCRRELCTQPSVLPQKHLVCQVRPCSLPLKFIPVWIPALLSFLQTSDKI